MGKPTNYITMREDEWEELEALIDNLTFNVEAVKMYELLEKILDRRIAEKKIISRARQLQDSQLLAAASFGTSKKKGPQIH